MGILLDPQAVRTLLLAQELFDEEDCPSLEGIANVIDSVEDWMTEWLDEDLTARDYLDEPYRVNTKGYVVLQHYPVTELIAVSYAVIGLDLFHPFPVTHLPQIGQGKQSLFFGMHFAGCNTRISYHATNLEENGMLPKSFNRTAMQIVMRALETTGTSGDLLFLSEPTKDTASISLPGGLSKSYQLGKGALKDGGTAGQSAGDRLMEGLTRYRRKYVAFT